jgi:ParB-like chromosome segregation protein Spo0J
MKTFIMISDIVIDPSLQTRSGRNQSVVQEYASAMSSGDEFPPVALFDDGRKIYLADGFHRIAAALSIGRDRIDAVINQGSKQDALLFSLKANSKHGLQRSNDDKRYAVRLLLDDFEYADKSDREIAELCAVSHTFVSKIRSDSKTATERKSKLKAKQVNPNVKPVPEVATLTEEEEYDQWNDVMKEIAEENESLKYRLSIQAMEATDEEKALAAEIIASLREENRILAIECNALKISRNTYQNQAAEAIKERNKKQLVIKKLNKQIAEIQNRSNSRPPEEESLPF